MGGYQRNKPSYHELPPGRVYGTSISYLKSDICGRGSVGSGSESGVSPFYPRIAETVIQGEQKRLRVHHLVCWLKSCRCTSPIKKEEAILAWRCKGHSRGSNPIFNSSWLISFSSSPVEPPADRTQGNIGNKPNHTAVFHIIPTLCLNLAQIRYLQTNSRENCYEEVF